MPAPASHWFYSLHPHSHDADTGPVLCGNESPSETQAPSSRTSVASGPPATTGSCICGSRPPHTTCLLKRAAAAPQSGPRHLFQASPRFKAWLQDCQFPAASPTPTHMLSLPGARRALVYLPALGECSTALLPPRPAPGSGPPPGRPLMLADAQAHATYCLARTGGQVHAHLCRGHKLMHSCWRATSPGL